MCTPETRGGRPTRDCFRNFSFFKVEVSTKFNIIRSRSKSLQVLRDVPVAFSASGRVKSRCTQDPKQPKIAKCSAGNKLPSKPDKFCFFGIAGPAIF